MSYAEAAWAIWEDEVRRARQRRKRRLRARATAGKRRRVAIFECDGWKCRVCGATEKLTIDHIIPLALGGDNHRGNLQVLCEDCNQAKVCSVDALHSTGSEGRP